MNKSILSVGLLSLLLMLSNSWASSIQLQALNYPVWVERDNQIKPLSAGAELQQGDVLVTGKQGRALLQLEDGSAIKLGQSARFKITTSKLENENDKPVLKAVVDVLQGAFRFTSAFFKPKTIKHQVDVKIGAITAGIRGTDIWGRSTREKDLVCLLEGGIDVNAVGQSVVKMTQPLDFYLKPKDQQAVVDKISQQQIEAWSAETELLDSGGIASALGNWDLVLASYQKLELAQNEITKFHQAGYDVRTETVDINGVSYQRLKLSGYDNQQAAENGGNLMMERFKLQDVWVKKRTF